MTRISARFGWSVLALVLLAAIAAGIVASRRRSARDHSQIAAANALTQRYAQSRLAEWQVRGSAADSDCTVLLIETSNIMDVSQVEALHFGAGAYDIYPGGVKQFTSDHAFRGVAYKDVTGRVWTYGAVSQSEGETLTKCR